jgi:NAD dependent epimerase/dehydratase
MRVFLTGAGGFIGSHVVEALLDSGHTVNALVRYTSQGTWGHLNHLRHREVANLHVHFGDVRDGSTIEQLVADSEVVLHLAALIGIPYSYCAIDSYVATNIGGTLNILQACRRASVRRVVITSTSEVYGSAQYTPIDELHPVQASSPYAATKIGADKLAESYFRSFDTPVVTLRPFNTYGPRQSARAIIPTVLSQALSGANEIELGNLEPRRDLTYVTDTARAFILAAMTPKIEGETIHVGNGEAFSVGEIARECLAVVGSTATIRCLDARRRPEKSEVGVLQCDAMKAHQLLKWQPTVSLREGLSSTAEYVRANLSAYQPRAYVV